MSMILNTVINIGFETLKFLILRWYILAITILVGAVYRHAQLLTELEQVIIDTGSQASIDINTLTENQAQSDKYIHFLAGQILEIRDTCARIPQGEEDI